MAGWMGGQRMRCCWQLLPADDPLKVEWWAVCVGAATAGKLMDGLVECGVSHSDLLRLPSSCFMDG